MDLLLTGAGLTICWVGGFYAGRVGKKKRKCGCDHHLSYHNIATGKCHVQLYDYDTGRRTSSCNCQQYTGAM